MPARSIQLRSRLKTPFGRRAAAIGVAGVALNRQIIGQYASFGRLGHADFARAWATKRILRRLLKGHWVQRLLWAVRPWSALPTPGVQRSGHATPAGRI